MSNFHNDVELSNAVYKNDTRALSKWRERHNNAYMKGKGHHSIEMVLWKASINLLNRKLKKTGHC